MDVSQNRCKLGRTLLFSGSLLFLISGDALAWHGGGGYHRGGYYHGGGWGHGYHNGWNRGGWNRGGWGYRGWGYGGGWGTGVLFAPAVVGAGYYAGCRWVPAHRNLNGHWVGGRRVCW